MLNSNALITVDTYATAARVDVPISGSLAQVEFDINAASTYVETYCNRTFLSGSLGTDEFTGQGYNDRYEHGHNTYNTVNLPIQGTPSLKYWDGDSWEDVDNTYDVDPTSEFIYLTDGLYFVEDRMYRTQYEYGYNGIANIPADLQRAVAYIAYMMNRQITYAGLAVETSEQVSRTFSFKLPAMIEQTLNKYKR